MGYINFLIDDGKFEKFISKSLLTNVMKIEAMHEIGRKMLSFDNISDIELLAYRRDLDSLLQEVLYDTTNTMKEFGIVNYGSLMALLEKEKSGINNLGKKNYTLYEIFQEKILSDFNKETIDITNIKNPLFAISLPSTTPELTKKTFIDLCNKFNVSILIGDLVMKNDQEVFVPRELLNVAKDYNKEGKIEFNIINNNNVFANIEIAEDVIKVNNPLKRS